MVTRRQLSAGLISAAALAATRKAGAQPATTIALPPPGSAGGMPLMEALKFRRSTRAYSATPLPRQLLSDLLWAAFGINRPASGDRTAPTWRHIMVIDVYVAMADGVWVYEPKPHELVLHSRADIRAATGRQDFAAMAPLNLIYVAHGDRMQGVSTEDRRLFAAVDAAFIGQNVYLFCASEKLATVFRGAIDYPKLAKALKLGAGQFVTFAQTVGYAA